MPRRSKPSKPVDDAGSPAPDAAGIVQIKVWLLGISPMVWRRMQVPSTCTLRQLHGVIQVTMGWESFHLYQFCLRSHRYGSSEVSASSPDVTLATLKLRRGARFTYEYDLNIPWRHEVRIEENWLHAEPGNAYPRCIGGAGACPPEDCDGPGGYLAGLEGATSMDALEDLGTMADIVGQVVLEGRTDLLDDDDVRWRLEEAMERGNARERAQGRPFVRRSVNTRLRKGEHLDLMHQRY